MKAKIPLSLTCLLGLTLAMNGQVFANAQDALWRGQSVSEFTADDNAAMEWQIVNDGVMGGLSKGNVEYTEEGTMRFHGDLSLENNGGFSTARSGDVDLNLSNDLGLLLRVKGDGRTYEARLESTADFRGSAVSFAGQFETVKDKWIQVKVPFSEFKGTFRGMELPDKELDPSVIRRLWILLGDKKSGPFNLEIDYIRTYGKGQGEYTERKPAEKKSAEEEGPKRLIATAVADGRFNTLKKALDAAGLTVFFQWDNPLTVIAPTDEAFAKLPEGVLEDLLKPENKQRLIEVLSYHVSAGSISVADALQSQKVKTVEGSPLNIAFSEGRIKINDAVLLDGDIQARDGIIHVVDTVLLPPKPAAPTVLSTAKDAGKFSTLIAAAKAAGLQDVLTGEDPITVLAPTDEAFGALPDGLVASLLKEENREALVEILTYHVFSGKVSAGDALNAGRAKTVQGDAVSFQIKDGTFKANQSVVSSVGVDAGNGIIHIVDQVLLPPAIARQLGGEASVEKTSTSSCAGGSCSASKDAAAKSGSSCSTTTASAKPDCSVKQTAAKSSCAGGKCASSATTAAAKDCDPGTCSVSGEVAAADKDCCKEDGNCSKEG